MLPARWRSISGSLESLIESRFGEGHSMRLLVACLALGMVFSAVVPAIADFKSDTQPYAAKCKAASFARRGPGTLSNPMREAEIKRCIKNKGFLD